MKSLALITAGLMLSVHAQAGSDVSLIASVQTNQFDVFEPITVVSQLTNGLPHPIQIGTCAILMDYEYSVVDGNRKVVPTTEHGKWQMAQNRHITSDYAYRLDPGKTETYTLQVNWFFDLTQPGKYFITVSKTFVPETSGDRKPVTVKSNEIEVLVRSKHLAPFVEHRKPNQVPEDTARKLADPQH